MNCSFHCKLFSLNILIDDFLVSCHLSREAILNATFKVDFLSPLLFPIHCISVPGACHALSLFICVLTHCLFSTLKVQLGQYRDFVLSASVHAEPLISVWTCWINVWVGKYLHREGGLGDFPVLPLSVTLEETHPGRVTGRRVFPRVYSELSIDLALNSELWRLQLVLYLL